MVAELPSLLDQARNSVAAFVGAQPQNLVFVRNTTEAVNAVLSSIDLGPGDEVLVTELGYPACNNAVARWCHQARARVVTLSIGFPVSQEELCLRLTEAVSDKTKLVLLDHVTSATGLVMPLEALAALVSERSVPLLVDGAHAPGMLELDLERLGKLGVSYYAGNLHKWGCAPKGAALLWVHPDFQAGLHPPVVSHGYTRRGSERPRLWSEFDWTGTDDPSAWLSAPFALEYVGGLAHGWKELRVRCRRLLARGVEVVNEVLQTDLPPALVTGGLMQTLELDAAWHDPDLPRRLYREYRLDTQILEGPLAGQRLLRLSAFLYNCEEDYFRLAQALKEIRDTGR